MNPDDLDDGEGSDLLADMALGEVSILVGQLAVGFPPSGCTREAAGIAQIAS